MGLLRSYLGDRRKKSKDRDSQQKSSDMAEAADYAGSYKRGGVVRKTGMARVHKGERVLTKRQARKYRSK